MKKVKVLLVDNNEVFFTLLKIKLKEYQLSYAGHEKSVYESIYTKNPDIILLDTYLPPHSGFDVLKGIRKKSSIPIIMLSTVATKKTILNAWQEGADYFLEKPCTINLLRENIDSIILGRKECVTNNFKSKFYFMNISGRYRPEVSKVLSYIEEYYNGDTSLTKLSEVANITPSYLSKAFKLDTGYALNNFVSRYRVNIADELFDKGMSVKEAAFHVGYCDEKYFSKVYKKINGFPPKEQKMAIQNKNNSATATSSY